MNNSKISSLYSFTALYRYLDMSTKTLLIFSAVLCVSVSSLGVNSIQSG